MMTAAKTVSIKWLALYKGAYTVDTLPEYRPKGFVEELRECQRYFYVMNPSLLTNESILYPAVTSSDSSNGTYAACLVNVPSPMRVTPTVSYPAGAGTLRRFSSLSSSTNVAVTDITLQDISYAHNNFRVVFHGAYNSSFAPGSVASYYAAGAFSLDANM